MVLRYCLSLHEPPADAEWSVCNRPLYRLNDLITRQEKLQSKLKEIRRTCLRQPNSSATPGMSFVGRAAFAAKFIPVGIQNVNNQGFVTVAKLQVVLDE